MHKNTIGLVFAATLIVVGFLVHIEAQVQSDPPKEQAELLSVSQSLDTIEKLEVDGKFVFRRVEWGWIVVAHGDRQVTPTVRIVSTSKGVETHTLRLSRKGVMLMDSHAGAVHVWASGPVPEPYASAMIRAWPGYSEFCK